MLGGELQRAVRNSVVMGESAGVSEGVEEGLPLECAGRCCQVNATLSLSVCIYLFVVFFVQQQLKHCLVYLNVAL